MELEPLLEPIPPVLRRLADYVPAVIQRPAPSASSNSRGSRVGSSSQTMRSNPSPNDASPATPTKLSDLSPESQETYKADRDDYKVQLEAYKIDEKKYAENGLTIGYLQHTFRAQYQRTFSATAASLVPIANGLLISGRRRNQPTRRTPTSTNKISQCIEANEDPSKLGYLACRIRSSSN